MSKRKTNSSADGMRLPELRIELEKRSLGTSGPKAQLLERLKKAIAEESSSSDGLSAANALDVVSPAPSCSNHDEDSARGKRARTTVSSISEGLICSISHELMVDPVCTSDGITYERKEIETWFQQNDTSPATNLRLDSKTLISNISAKNTIAKLLASGELEQKVCEDWEERKRDVDLIRAQKLFDEKKVEEAAKLGHPRAQGMMACRFRFGIDGEAKDEMKSVYWAKKAATGGDMNGQFLLADAYEEALGGLEKNNALALEWYIKAAEQGCASSMKNISNIYESGGHGVTSNLETAASWCIKAAEKGCICAQHNLGSLYYNGKGVAKSLVTARHWYQKSVDQYDEDKEDEDCASSQCELGTMIMKGEGGGQDPEEAVSLWKKAAAQGNVKARGYLEKMKTFNFDDCEFAN
eukprot:CAMPEP_0171912888 /NCGR_PEP_ID=MMETSP0993-20121228/11415_1 /TAXON_ID=483369 /ORGANISM="non described non described, Strain CCMP2098" /LENGTH=410 /DNA_ID=CAMNT_0012546805 /DNA_START=21 /DNA_END=1253 /DNA_ORIENTATION=+